MVVSLCSNKALWSYNVLLVVIIILSSDPTRWQVWVCWAGSVWVCVHVCVCPSGSSRLICATVSGTVSVLVVYFIPYSSLTSSISLLYQLYFQFPLFVCGLENDFGNFCSSKWKAVRYFLPTFFFISVVLKAFLFFCLSLSACQLAAYLPSGVYWPALSPPLYLPIYSSLHPFIPPSCQAQPVLPGGCALAGLWNETVLCCFWHLARLRLFLPSSLSFFCKTHRLIGCFHSKRHSVCVGWDMELVECCCVVRW